MQIDSKRGRAALLVGHIAGMVDMVALPVWVGTLVQRYGLNAQQAGGLVTLFLSGVVVASVLLAPRFEALPRRWMPTLGYGVAALAFIVLANLDSFPAMAALHVIGGLGVGCGLSFTHGTIGRTANPHRTFAWAQAALGVFAVGFLGVVPKVVAARSGAAFFVILAAVMLTAMLVVTVGFPASRAAIAEKRTPVTKPPIPRATWFVIAAVTLLTLNQAMVFSFLERIGVDRHFGAARVNLVLLMTGIVALFPAIIAAWQQKRLHPRTVALIAPWAQALLALTISTSLAYGPYALAGSAYPFVTLFAHTFLFGWIARLDPSGRAVALTPAMVMSGSAIGPFVAGTLVLGMGYGAIGAGVVVVALLSTVLLSRIPRSSAAIAAETVMRPAP
ncbi:MFS transporter [Paraburkholderia sp. J67]|uniref:MFS transporter n=1 Tax=Paraburkholderia sp. J67 TaxID=2805435 RepID=UPI002ABDAB51|nr:MFS transporter [Paraburkholderia sp. J67]